MFENRNQVLFSMIVLTIGVQNVVSVSWEVSRSGDGVEWSLNCDWRGNDIGGVQSKGEECGWKCKENGDCTHFTWTDFLGGTCWLKRSNVCPKEAFDKFDSNAICGYIPSRNSGCGHNYALALGLSQKFYEANRCGPLPGDNRVPWRKSSFLNDGQDVGKDLTGGYFDAGDHVKFGFPMAYSITVLAMGMIDFASGYQTAGQTALGVRTLKWGTDYFIKCHTAPNELYGQVGKGDVDHAFWGRPEDWPGNKERPSFKIDTGRPGSDLAAETAAALAASSIVFRANGNPSYADECVKHAKELYSFANDHRGKYSDSITDARNFYQSWSGFNDELVWAAAWLHRATKEDFYLTEAKNKWNEFNFDNAGPDQFSWDDKSAGVFALMYRITNDNRYGSKLKQTCDKFASTRRTPGGLIFITEWGPARHAANAAFILLEADSLGLGGGSYKTLAKQQIDYLLGVNPLGMSYLIGYTNNHPQKPHHRSSSCPTPQSCGQCACDWNNFNSPNPNPNLLEGALVGGPNSNDQFDDRRDDFVRNEVATDYNAALQGAFAALA